MDIKMRLAEKIRQTAQKAIAEGVVKEGALPEVLLTVPPKKEFGDFATNFAMQSARSLHCNPRVLAQYIVEHLTGGYVQKAEIAGPGFINFYLNPDWVWDMLAEIVEAGENYGNLPPVAGEKIQLEYVSANPTGPLHVGHGRGAAVGSALGNLLKAAGYQVEREYYINDAGNQMDNLARSVNARYLELSGRTCEFPEDGYHGQDIVETARRILNKYGDKFLQMEEAERLEQFKTIAYEEKLAALREDLEHFNVHFDFWFSEKTLHEANKIKEACDTLLAKGYMYEKDGALWLKTSDILAAQLRQEGKSDEAIEKLGLKDDVLRRANGFYTYFAADIAYHRNKFEKRGFDRVINIWGADHHGHVKRLQCALDALGLDGSHRLEIVLMQLVRMMQGGEVVRMSKRTGKAISLTDLLDEIPVDACRWFFNAKPETQMEFDLGLAVREDSENPVYYVQYAYARICTLVKALAAEGYTVPAAAKADLSVLTADEEKALIKQLAQYPAVVQLAARDYDPSFINRYLVELAAAFHKFYNACRIKGEAEAVLRARLKLADTARAVLKNGMTLIGCSAPEKM